jgi:hypothetical protein
MTTVKDLVVPRIEEGANLAVYLGAGTGRKKRPRSRNRD